MLWALALVALVGLVKAPVSHRFDVKRDLLENLDEIMKKTNQAVDKLRKLDTSYVKICKLSARTMLELVENEKSAFSQTNECKYDPESGRVTGMGKNGCVLNLAPIVQARYGELMSFCEEHFLYVVEIDKDLSELRDTGDDSSGSKSKVLTSKQVEVILNSCRHKELAKIGKVSVQKILDKVEKFKPEKECHIGALASRIKFIMNNDLESVPSVYNFVYDHYKRSVSSCSMKQICKLARDSAAQDRKNIKRFGSLNMDGIETFIENHDAKQICSRLQEIIPLHELICRQLPNASELATQLELIKTELTEEYNICGLAVLYDAVVPSLAHKS